MGDAVAEALTLVFDSDSDREDGEQTVFITDVGGIPGLALYKSLSSSEQDALVECVEREGWLGGHGMNQAMVFGDLPAWATSLAARLPKDLFPDQISNRKPLFDQLTVNRYQPGEGLTAHVDLQRFEDGICIFSLGSPAVMQFTPAHGAPNVPKKEQSSHASWKDDCLSVLLQPGDVLGLSGEARWEWKHGIAATEVDCWHDDYLERGLRTSVTLRRMAHDNHET